MKFQFFHPLLSGPLKGQFTTIEKVFYVIIFILEIFYCYLKSVFMPLICGTDCLWIFIKENLRPYFLISLLIWSNVPVFYIVLISGIYYLLFYYFYYIEFSLFVTS